MRALLSRRDFIKTSVVAAGLHATARLTRVATVARRARTIARGPFQPTWESLAQNYRAPAWFRDAKFGIWAHWSAQCVPEQGDWYARRMYTQGDPDYDHHIKTFGYPSKSGFMEIDNLWKAERWEPEKLMALYKRAGAQYLFALANHHDNFDAYDSKHHAWNSVNVGPKKDIVAHYYNANLARNKGELEAVVNAKHMKPEHVNALVEDIERGVATGIRPHPWQTDTCIGSWHYSRAIAEQNRYKTVGQVVDMLLDIVSKNGNLMLSVPVRGDGTIDEHEVAFLEGMAAWMQANGEGVFGSRLWKLYGEGPSTAETPKAGQFGGARDVRSKPYTIEDIRFIKQAQGIGLSLDEIERPLATGGGANECRGVRDLLRAKLAELDERMKAMKEFRSTLARHLSACKRELSRQDESAKCPVLMDIAPLRRTAKSADESSGRKKR